SSRLLLQQHVCFSELLRLVDIKERIYQHVANFDPWKIHLDGPLLPGKLPNFSFLAFEEVLDGGCKGDRPKPDHWMDTFIRSRHEERGAPPLLVSEAPNQIGRKERRVGCNGDSMIRAGTVRFDPFKAGVYPGESACEAGNTVRDDRKPVGGKTRAIPIGIDPDAGDLRLQTFDNAGNDRLAFEQSQAFVAAAHAARLATGKKQADDTFS